MPFSFAQFYFSPAGRISRSQYWLRYFLPVFVVGLLLSLCSEIANSAGSLAIGTLFGALYALFVVATLWPGLAVLVKRIHDRNRPGALVWLLYGPAILATIFTIAAFLTYGTLVTLVAAVLWLAVLGVGVWFFVEFGCLRGTQGANRYGPDPVLGR